jgi:hypothetical protein
MNRDRLYGTPAKQGEKAPLPPPSHSWKTEEPQTAPLSSSLGLCIRSRPRLQIIFQIIISPLKSCFSKILWQLKRIPDTFLKGHMIKKDVFLFHKKFENNSLKVFTF